VKNLKKFLGAPSRLGSSSVRVIVHGFQPTGYKLFYDVYYGC
jgi:hypothetical protein